MGRGLLLSALWAFAACAAGCGSSLVTIEAKVVKGGQPYALKSDEYWNVSISSEDGKSTHTAKVGPDGALPFEAPVAPGKYKIQVIRYKVPAEGAKGPPTPPMTIEVNETWEVSSSNRSFTLDADKLGLEKLDKKPGKKK